MIRPGAIQPGTITRPSAGEPFYRITRTHALKGSHAFGDLISARVPLETDYLSDLVLRVRLPELPTGYQWVNGIGYNLFERITIRHEDTILYVLRNMNLEQSHRHSKSDQHLYHRDISYQSSFPF